jgi:hypothetical protein
MRKDPARSLAAALMLVCVGAVRLGSEPAPDAVTGAVLERDRAFWAAYNRCDVPAMADFFTEDIEFYHDRGGATIGHAPFVAELRNGLCGNPDSRLRRDAVEGTVKLYPMKKNDVVYGAVLSGEHVFYVVDKGKEPRLDGRGRFTHLWLVKDGVWRMSRVLSFDHGPAVK